LNKSFYKQFIYKSEQIPILNYVLKWIFFALIIGFFTGSTSAFFLISLQFLTDWRVANTFIIWFLPLAGLTIGLTYHYFGSDVVRGNNQLFDEFHKPDKIIPFKMAPLILFGTLATHLFGGSAGREGTAVQMGGAIADQFTSLFKLKNRDRKIILIMGISAGFASVFGTPLAGAIFALEVLIIGRIRHDAILPSFFAAVFGNYFCQLWGAHHIHYSIEIVPTITLATVSWTIVTGILFGLTASLFSTASNAWTQLFSKTIAYPPLRPLVGGIFLTLYFLISGSDKYLGLGVPVIFSSFHEQQEIGAFLIKLILTTFTLGSGFKGGEVTPLFFIGATLGNALMWIIPLPMDLLAGMGFVAVFAGATNTPIACIFMGIELFGSDSAVYISLAVIMAYLFSGHSGIYSSQIIGSPKHNLFIRTKGKSLKELSQPIKKKNLAD
jgi:H+/Cl- antiporter ClcA